MRVFAVSDNTQTPECNSLLATGRANSHLPELSSTLFLVFPELYEEVGVPSDTRRTSGYKTYEEPKMAQENPGYTELDKNTLHNRNATDDSTYQKLQRQDSDYVIPAHERRESYEDIKIGRNLPGYEELDQSKREADDYTPLTKSGQKPELA
jgi:hypothetical protein